MSYEIWELISFRIILPRSDHFEASPLQFNPPLDIGRNSRSHVSIAILTWFGHFIRVLGAETLNLYLLQRLDIYQIAWAAQRGLDSNQIVTGNEPCLETPKIFLYPSRPSIVKQHAGYGGQDCPRELGDVPFGKKGPGGKSRQP